MSFLKGRLDWRFYLSLGITNCLCYSVYCYLNYSNTLLLGLGITNLILGILLIVKAFYTRSFQKEVKR